MNIYCTKDDVKKILSSLGSYARNNRNTSIQIDDDLDYYIESMSTELDHRLNARFDITTIDPNNIPIILRDFCAHMVAKEFQTNVFGLNDVNTTYIGLMDKKIEYYKSLVVKGILLGVDEKPMSTRNKLTVSFTKSPIDTREVYANGNRFNN